MIDTDSDLFIVTDLKQYAYCPRVIYYERCMPDFRPRTFKMDAGVIAHEHERKKAARRTLRGYGLENGDRQFEVTLRSEQLGLIGKLDEVVVIPGPPLAVYPVDYKLARRASPHHALQLAAYALLLEEAYQVAVPHGYLYLIPNRRVEQMLIDDKLRQQVQQALEWVRRITDQELMPPAPRSRRRCENCEFRRACNDF